MDQLRPEIRPRNNNSWYGGSTSKISYIYRPVNYVIAWSKIPYYTKRFPRPNEYVLSFSINRAHTLFAEHMLNMQKHLLSTCWKCSSRKRFSRHTLSKRWSITYPITCWCYKLICYDYFSPKRDWRLSYSQHHKWYTSRKSLPACQVITGPGFGSQSSKDIWVGCIPF